MAVFCQGEQSLTHTSHITPHTISYISRISHAHHASQNAANEKRHSYVIHTSLALIELRRTLPTRKFIHTSFIHLLRSLCLAERCQRETLFILPSYISRTHCAPQNAANETPHTYIRTLCFATYAIKTTTVFYISIAPIAYTHTPRAPQHATQ